MQIKIAFLKSKVAKRFFYLFVASSIIPIFLVGALSYNYVTSLLTEQKQDFLNNAGKAYGMAIYDRMLIAEQQFEALHIDVVFQDQLVNSSFQSTAKHESPLFGEIILRESPGYFNFSDLRHMGEGNVSITVSKNDANMLDIYFSKLIISDNRHVYAIAKSKPEYLFHDKDYFSGVEDACVVIRNIGTLNCSNEKFYAIAGSTFVNNNNNNNNKLQNIYIDNTEYVVSDWELFLKGRFNTNSWSVYYAEPSNIIFAPVQSFIKILLPSLLVSILFISLVCLRQISTILIPLEKLLSLTKKVAKSDYGEKVEFTSDDEFQDLGESFNFMTGELQKRERSLVEQAYYDHLTGLPSRQFLLEKIDFLISDGSSEKFAFLFIDLDRFKVINDSHGHHIGDKLLVVAAERITSCVSSMDTVSRYGGDEFGVIIYGDDCVRSAKKYAKNIIKRMSETFHIDNYEQYIGASIGISVFPNDGETSDDVVQKADIAMYKAKQRGRGKCVLFSDTMQSDIREKLRLETDLFHAIEKNEVYLVYQPQLDLTTDRVSGVEVLMRWKHHEFGIIRPDRFIEYAEGNGFIVPLGKWAIQEAIKQCEQWQLGNYSIPKVAINVSPKQLQHESFIDDVEGLMSDIDMGITNIEFEITESLFLNDEKLVQDILKRINQLGIGIAIDDFGKGYSSLSYLKNFPTQTLKIDRLFIKDLDSTDESRSIVKAIIAMGKALNKIVIAEGVETVEQLNILKELGCHRAQGYYISKPKLADELMGDTKTRIIQIEQFKSNYNIG